jgi:hypothetical protein
MSPTNTPNSAPEGIAVDDVVQGIMRLPLPAQKRMELLKKLYESTENLKEGLATIDGSFREELFQLFSQRNKAVNERLDNLTRLRAKNDKKSRELAEVPLESAEEVELSRIVEETRGDFEALGTKLSDFEKKTRVDLETEVRNTSDAAGIKAARDALKGEGSVA